ncbi:MAG: hypothetical protein ACI828_000969 [Flavobacteriales bacterium]|jgi:uncharacterized protein (TIGR02117 family)
MKKGLKYGIKAIGYVLLIPGVYILVSLILTYIPISEETNGHPKKSTIYLTTNGVHSAIVIPKNLMPSELISDLRIDASDRFFAFGWGEENFYLNTPTWGELKFSTAFRAAFLESSTLVHLTRHKVGRKQWIAVPVTENQLAKLNNYILASFDLYQGKKTRLDVPGYTKDRDDFYPAVGNYMFYNTCNSWVNTALKKSDMKACLWTPFEFGALRRHQD